MEHLSLILSSISPLLTIDSNLKITYMNQSFRTEFSYQLNEEKYLFEIIKLSPKDKKKLLKNLEISKRDKVENSEFQLNNKVYGYSIFSLENEYIIILKDVTENYYLRRQIELLNKKLLKIQEEERERISKELHDEIQQNIYAVRVNLELLQKKNKEFNKLFEPILIVLDKTNLVVKKLHERIYPRSVIDLGLEASIKILFKKFNKPNCHFSLIELTKNKFTRDKSLGIYRIIEEILIQLERIKKFNIRINFCNKKKSIILLDAKSKLNENKNAKSLYQINNWILLQERVKEISSKLKIENQNNLIEFKIEISNQKRN